MRTNILSKFIPDASCYSFVGKKMDYIMKSARVSSGGLKTENINACVAGVIGNGKHNLMFHLAPEQQGIRSLRDLAKEKVDELVLRTNGEQLDGFLFGGWASTVSDKETAGKAIDFYNILAEVFEDLGANLSFICGSKKPHKLGHLFAREDRVNLVLDDYKKLGLDPMKIKNMSQEEVKAVLEDVLSEHYETVELHPEHFFKIA
ncbi:hypothetical protein IJD34_03145 [bacterium]|nr:hypothetical protein [bacterium]